MSLDELRQYLGNPVKIMSREAYDFTHSTKSPAFSIDTLTLSRMSDEELGPLWAQWVIEREED